MPKKKTDKKAPKKRTVRQQTKKTKQQQLKQNVHVNVQSSGSGGGGGSSLPQSFQQKPYGENVKIENLLSEISKKIEMQPKREIIQQPKREILTKEMGTSPIDIQENKNNESLLEKVSGKKRSEYVRGPIERTIAKEVALSGGTREQAIETIIQLNKDGVNLQKRYEKLKPTEIAAAEEFIQREINPFHPFYQEPQANEPMDLSGIDYLQEEYNSPFAK